MRVLEKGFPLFRCGKTNLFDRFDAEWLYDGFEMHPRKSDKVKNDNGHKELAANRADE